MAAQQRRWGWHQLDPSFARAFVDDAGIARGDLVLDVGAGFGALTGPLIVAGARVIAVETHPDRARYLREHFDVTVVQADGGSLRLPRRPYHVVANPPFEISGPLLRRLVQPGSQLVSARLIVQDKTARWWARPDAPGAQRWGRLYRVELGRPVPRRAFRPPPHVDARVLTIRRLTPPDASPARTGAARSGGR